MSRLAVRTPDLPLLFPASVSASASTRRKESTRMRDDGSTRIRSRRWKRKAKGKKQERRERKERPAGVLNVENGRAARAAMQREMERTFGILPSALYMLTL